MKLSCMFFFILLPLDWPRFRVKSDEFFYGGVPSRRFAVG